MTRRRQGPWRLVDLLVLASAASATTVSLSSFELLSFIFISPQCLDTYNTPLEGCTISDFLSGSQCSRTCIRNLRQTELAIQEACQGVKPRPGTLLDRTQDGDLVAALCGAPDNEEPVSTSTAGNGIALPTRTKTVTRAITPAPPATFVTKTTEQSRAETTDSSTSRRTTTSARPVDPPRSSKTSSSEATSEVESTQSRATQPPVVRTSETTSAATSSTSTATADSGDDDSSDDRNPEDARPPGSGGGGLADFGFEAGAPACRQPHAAGIAAGAAVLAGWWTMW